MNEPLRPMSLGEILDRTFQIYRAKFLVFAGIAAIPALVIVAVEAANRLWWGLTPYPYSGNIHLTLAQLAIYTAVLYQLALLLHLLVWPSYAGLTSQLYFGEPANLSSATFRGDARWRSWLWMAVASWGIVLILPELLIGGIVIGALYLLSEVVKVGDAAMDTWAPWIFYPGCAVCCLVFFWLSSSLFVAVPAKSLERLSVGKSLRRSWTLSKGSRWRILFVRIALYIAAWLLNLSLLTVLNLLTRWFMFSSGASWHYYRNIYTGLGFLAAFTASTLFGPILPIAITLIYYDQRIRLEGYDIERMMEAAGMNAPVTQPAKPEEGQA
jgi:hypothetical protein